MPNEEFKGLLAADPRVSLAQGAALLRYRTLVLEENEVQNLTRLTSPFDFYASHVVDALAVMESGFLGPVSLEIGSGMGVPGLICALFGDEKWILTESERRKADFIQRAAEELGLQERVRVFGARAEDVLRNESAPVTLVARAVGPVERIYNWVRTCSTWNKILLLKGPAWSEEWAAFRKSKHGKELQTLDEREYSAPDIAGATRSRRLVLIGRAG